MTAKLKNYVAIVLDRSSSMGGIREATVKAYNDMVDTIRRQTNETGQETSVSFATFASNSRIEYFNQPVDRLQHLRLSEYVPNGMTALFDGLGDVIDAFRRLPDANDENVSFLVITITDGEENASDHHRPERVKDWLYETQKTDRWTYAFQMPPGHGESFARSYGIPNDNIHEWEQTTKGVAVAARATNSGLVGYYAARSKGQRSVRNFYDMTTDLSKVDVKTIKAKLDDISDRFATYTVPKEVAVKEFVEKQTGREYVIGSAYYQLMKPEIVQTSKDVLVMEKGKKAIWGGRAARDLIGLPHDKTARVTPGNHANLDIFIKSTSVNRKLVRGTKVLVDETKKSGEVPTWDHTAVGAKV